MPRLIDQFGLKRCQKKHKDVRYQLVYKFFQKYLIEQERSAVKNLFSTYVWSKVDSCFYGAVYVAHSGRLRIDAGIYF